MKNQQMKVNNKGFSLVELIIVIAIMAILAGALAPQFIKYVAKSRKATDNQNIDLLISTTNAVLADPDVTPAAGTIEITAANAVPTYSAGIHSTFKTAFEAAVGNKYPMSKESSGQGFTITIGGTVATGLNVSCEVTTP